MRSRITYTRSQKRSSHEVFALRIRSSARFIDLWHNSVLMWVKIRSQSSTRLYQRATSSRSRESKFRILVSLRRYSFKAVCVVESHLGVESSLTEEVCTPVDDSQRFDLDWNRFLRILRCGFDLLILLFEVGDVCWTVSATKLDHSVSTWDSMVGDRRTDSVQR